jgi:hypothetical protein
MPPPGTVIEGGGQHRKGRNAVQNHRKSEPEQSHTFSFARWLCAKIQYICIAPVVCDHAHRSKIGLASVTDELEHLEGKAANAQPTQEGHHQHDRQAKDLSRADFRQPTLAAALKSHFGGHSRKRILMRHSGAFRSHHGTSGEQNSTFSMKAKSYTDSTSNGYSKLHIQSDLLESYATDCSKYD